MRKCITPANASARGMRFESPPLTVEPVGPVIRSYRPLKGQQRRQLVRGALPGAGLRRLLVAFWPAQFITVAARNIHRSGCSLRDVQLLAGHRSIETTERYIDGDTCTQRRLVAYV
jgi:hypothetical protein